MSKQKAGRNLLGLREFLSAEEMAPMPEKKPSVQEFEHRVNALIHLPTGATWTLRPGSTDVRSFKPSNLGVALPDGNFYAEGEVRTLAMILIQRPPQSPKEVEERDERRVGARDVFFKRRLGGTVKDMS
jgi:hypothetical protein